MVFRRALSTLIVVAVAEWAHRVRVDVAAVPADVVGVEHLDVGLAQSLANHPPLVEGHSGQVRVLTFEGPRHCLLLRKRLFSYVLYCGAHCSREGDIHEAVDVNFDRLGKRFLHSFLVFMAALGGPADAHCFLESPSVVGGYSLPGAHHFGQRITEHPHASHLVVPSPVVLVVFEINKVWSSDEDGVSVVEVIFVQDYNQAAGYHQARDGSTVSALVDMMILKVIISILTNAEETSMTNVEFIISKGLNHWVLLRIVWIEPDV